jgi:hypothetical protein
VLYLPDKALTAIDGTAKYALGTAGASIHIGRKDDPADRFLPEIHATRPAWNDKTFLKIRHSDARRSLGEKHQLVKGRGKQPDLDAIQWKIGGRTHHFIQGSVEHTITYDSPADVPSGGVEIYDIDFPANNLEWYLQPALVQQEQASGCQCPENVIGSYAVYGPTSGNFLDRSGNPLHEYATGKFCHVYRPQLIAANGTKVWCNQRYDPMAKQLAISLPADFTASAQYPLVLDPTFGFIQTGGLPIAVDNAACGVDASLLYTANAGDTITDFYLDAVDFNGNNATAAVYTIVSGVPGARLALPAPFPILRSDDLGWVIASTAQPVSQAMQPGVTYGIAVAPYAAGEFWVAGDVTETNCLSQRSAQTLPTTWDGGGANLAFRGSWYAVYTVGNTSGGPFPHHLRRAMLGGTID